MCVCVQHCFLHRYLAAVLVYYNKNILPRLCVWFAVECDEILRLAEQNTISTQHFFIMSLLAAYKHSLIHTRMTFLLLNHSKRLFVNQSNELRIESIFNVFERSLLCSLRLY